MRIYFLGSGTMFCPPKSNYNSNIILESDSGKYLLIDCGIDIRHALADTNYAPQDIDAVYISHFHSDHVGGLEWLALARKFIFKNKKPGLIIHPDMQKQLWENVLSGGLMTLDHEAASLQSYFKLHPIEQEQFFTWESIQFQMVQTQHIFHNHQQAPSYGLFFSDGKQNIFFTSDARFTPDAFMPYYKKADCIFHECETAPEESGVHSPFEKLCTLPAAIKKKTWLYHYSARNLPDAVNNGFAGYVKRGQSFDSPFS